MGNHIGEIISIANQSTKGVINDHVAVQPHLDIGKSTYNAYARGNYNVNKGPEPMPRGDRSNRMPNARLGERLREWEAINEVCNDVPLEEALRLATAEAQERNVVLYLEKDPERKTEIRWHPDGWQPVQG